MDNFLAMLKIRRTEKKDVYKWLNVIKTGNRGFNQCCPRASSKNNSHQIENRLHMRKWQVQNLWTKWWNLICHWCVKGMKIDLKNYDRNDLSRSNSSVSLIHNHVNHRMNYKTTEECTLQLSFVRKRSLCCYLSLYNLLGTCNLCQY